MDVEAPRGPVRMPTPASPTAVDVAEIRREERRKLGQDIHDDLGQELAGLAMMAATLARRVEGLDPRIANLARDLADGLVDTQHTARRLAHGLCGRSDDDLDLARSLERMAEQSRRRCGISCEVVGDTDIRLESPEVHRELARIAREAVANAIRHGQADTVELELHRRDGGFEFEVRDDGAGFEPRTGGGGMGLRNMRERARRVGGQLSIGPVSGGGTAVRCSVQGATS